MTDPTAEPSQRDRVVVLLSQWLLDHSGEEYPDYHVSRPAAQDAVDFIRTEIAAVRDAEMEQLRERCAYWEKRFQQQCERIDDTAMSIISLSSENERLRAELAGLRERAETALYLIGDVPPSGNHLLLAVRAALTTSAGEGRDAG